MTELNKEYGLDERRIDVQRWRICPIDVKSQHDGKKYTITKKAAEKFKNEIEHMPLYYGEYDKDLPIDHKGQSRKVIGTGLKGFIETDEYGTEWLTGDYAVYTDVNEEIVQKIKEITDNPDERDRLSSSWEIDQFLVDNNGNIYDGNYEGTAIMDAEHSAYRHHGLLVANRTGQEQKEGGEMVDEESKELLNKILEAVTVQTKLTVDDQIDKKDDKQKDLENRTKWTEDEIKWAKENGDKVKDLEKQLKEQNDLISELKIEKKSLADINKKFMSL